MPRVNPAILRWAREAAGFGLAEAARKIGINTARGIDAAERLQLIEAGDSDPSRSVLTRMAATYRRPLLSFYLLEPPPAGERIEDFRALPDRYPESEPLVQALARDVRARQTLVRELLEDEEAAPLRFIGSQTRQDGTDAVAAALAADLQFSLEAFRASPTIDGAFSYVRERAEAAGIFVLLIGDLGSHHSELDTEAFRGFALADPIAPFVVINDRDARSAWAFTLLHELVHLWLGVSGVSGARAETAVERFCNEVASLILLPAQEARAFVLPAGIELGELADAVAALARPRKLSRTLIALRLHQIGRISQGQWEALRARFRDEWRAERARRRAERNPDAGGPNAYVVRRHHLGSALVSLVARSVTEGTLTPSKAGKVLGVRARSVDALLSGRAA